MLDEFEKLAAERTLYRGVLDHLKEVDADPHWRPTSEADRYAMAFMTHGYGMGWKEGRERGVIQGKIDALLAVLRSRGLKVSPEAAHYIQFRASPGRIDFWLQHAATVPSVEKLSLMYPPERRQGSETPRSSSY